MPLLRFILISVLIINTLGSSILIPVIHLDFALRRDYIAKVLCINRDKPIAVCGGQCYLKARLKILKDQENKQQETSTEIREIHFFNQELTNSLPDNKGFKIEPDFLQYQDAIHKDDLTHLIFKPPQS